MTHSAPLDVGSVIKAHTERKSIEQLTAEGKRHFRVVSGKKVMSIIEAVVDDAIRRGTQSQVDADRAKLISQTRSRFDEIMSEQGRQERSIRDLTTIRNRLTEELQAERDEVERLRDELQQQQTTESARRALQEAEWQERVGELQRQAHKQVSALDEARTRLMEQWESERAELDARYEMLDEDRVRLAEALANSERKLSSLMLDQAAHDDELVRRYEEQIGRLQEERASLLKKFEEEQGAVAAGQEKELTRASRQIGELGEQLVEAHTRVKSADERSRRLARTLRRYRRRVRGRPAPEPVVVPAPAHDLGELRGELDGLRTAIESRRADATGVTSESMDSLLDRLGKRDEALRGDFDFQMDRTIDEINLAIRRATGQPVGDEVEATDILVARIFDSGAEMSTNLSSLTVQESKSNDGITGNLAQLRAARVLED